MTILAVFDNPKFLDRYTFVLDSKQNDLCDMLGTSEHGTGISQFSQGKYNPKNKNIHLGKQVDFDSLNSEVKTHVLDRIN
jgi:hypothetical protein